MTEATNRLPADPEPVLALVKQGKKLQAIADEYGVTREAVRQYLAKHGLPSTRDITKQRQKHGLSLVKKGKTFSAAARQAGIGESSLRHLARKAGIPVPKRPRKHGTLSTYQKGCRCDACAMANRHQQHRIHRQRYPQRELASYRIDRLPCRLCAEEGFEEPIRTITKRCPYCGDVHAVQA